MGKALYRERYGPVQVPQRHSVRWRVVCNLLSNQNGKPYGKGKYYLPDQAYFEGVSVDADNQGFSYNYLGYGRIIQANGDYYEG
jgi:hypothetical protein